MWFWKSGTASSGQSCYLRFLQGPSSFIEVATLTALFPTDCLSISEWSQFHYLMLAGVRKHNACLLIHLLVKNHTQTGEGCASLGYQGLPDGKSSE